MKITISRLRASWLVAIVLCAMATHASAAATDSFSANYSVSYGFLGLGTLSFELKPGDHPNCYVYSGHGQPSALVSMLVGNLSDVSRFCVTDQDTLRPRFFRHHEQDKPKHSYTLQFDWTAGTVRYQNRSGNTRVMTLPKTATDPLSLQVAARMWVARSVQPGQTPAPQTRKFTLVDEDKIKTYTLAIKPGGTINVPAGRFDTVIVERVDHDSKVLRFWLAGYADWIPVRVEHVKDGRTITMNLKSLQQAD